MSKTHVQTLRNVLYMLRAAATRSRSEDSGVRYVLPVLWMTSYFPITGLMARGVGNIYVSAVLEQVVINFQRIRQGAAQCLTLLAITTSGALP